SIIRLSFLPRERFSFYESKTQTVNSTFYVRDGGPTPTSESVPVAGALMIEVKTGVGLRRGRRRQQRLDGTAGAVLRPHRGTRRIGIEGFRELGPVANHGVGQGDFITHQRSGIRHEEILQLDGVTIARRKTQRRENRGRVLIVKLVGVDRNIVRQREIRVARRTR